MGHLSEYLRAVGDGLARVLPACLAAGLLWVGTVIRFAFLMRDIHVLNHAISASDASQDEEPEGASPITRLWPTGGSLAPPFPRIHIGG